MPASNIIDRMRQMTKAYTEKETKFRLPHGARFVYDATTGATKDEPGTVLMEKKRGRVAVLPNKLASSAARSMKRLFPVAANTVDLIAASVPFESGKTLVYNLTVSECNEYFANGVLVHNCDATRYMLHSHRMDMAVQTKPLRLPEKKKMVVV